MLFEEYRYRYSRQFSELCQIFYLGLDLNRFPKWKNVKFAFAWITLFCIRIRKLHCIFKKLDPYRSTFILEAGF
jgi:hypothetical protein